MLTPRPWTLIAELTYACRLRCAYCSNPVESKTGRAQLSTADWTSVLRQAEGLGVVQAHFTGGEPLLYPELEVLVARARELELYSTLVTSGVPLQKERLSRLKAAGLEHVQLSLQSLRPQTARGLAGTDQLQQKLAVARWVKELGLALTLNVVLTRHNIDEVDGFIALAEQLAPERLELANAQYLGWALHNRDQLLPSAASVERARQAARAARERLLGKLDVMFVLPDYYANRPRACMEGWANRYLVVTPDGQLLPCHAGHAISELVFDDVRDAPLSELWARSPALRSFRGDAWMKAPCKTCEQRSLDFAGCRCQAYQLTRDVRAADPACQLAPTHHLVQLARARAEAPLPVPLTLRRPPRPLEG